MNKAFIFDMDGVLVDSEQIWTAEEPVFMTEIFGEDIARKIGSTMGVSVNEIYAQAVKYDAHISKEVYLQRFDEKARSIY